MGLFPIGTVISAVLAMIAIVYYIVTLIKVKDDSQFDYLFSHSSQVTFLVFLLSFGILLIWIISQGLSGAALIKALMVILAIISVTNMISLLYYKHQLKK